MSEKVDINKLIDFDSMIVQWDEVKKMDEFKDLQSTMQSTKWHGEGNVFIHTYKVCTEATKTCQLNGWTNGNELGKLLITAALFHDIGKPIVSKHTDDWHSYGHEGAGEKITRRLLWGEDVRFRESVCALVRHHMDPFNVLKSANIASTILSLSKNVPSIRLLVELKRCDVRGSEPADTTMKSIDLQSLNELEQYACQLCCYDGPSGVPTKNQKSWQEWKKGLDTKPYVHVNILIGLPGAGKSTHAKNIIKKRQESEDEEERNKYVVISRDQIRAELGFTESEDDKKVCKWQQEDKVSEVFNERLLEAARRGKYIFVDNINAKKKYRDMYKSVLKDFSVFWTYTYIEAEGGIKTNIKRREGQITAHVLETMIYGIEWPEREEYDALDIQKS